jgi:predicted GNAT superfamily acetyltransferase
MTADHWAEAQAAATAAGVEVEPLESLEDAESITEVMVATWGNHQEVPRELIRALQGSGNAPWGALHNGRLVGYVLGWLGRDDEGLHIHSHMLAVLAEWRAKGVGYALKLAQRAAALDAGVDVVRWTFDPVNAANAYFNLAKLGAEADAFHRSYYGRMDDALNRGERSDRLVARWDLSRVAPGPSPDDGAVIVVDRSGPDDACEPTDVTPPSAIPALVRIPPAYRELRAASPELAERWRDAIAGGLEACLAAGLRATGFTSTATYVFT